MPNKKKTGDEHNLTLKPMVNDNFDNSSLDFDELDPNEGVIYNTTVPYEFEIPDQIPEGLIPDEDLGVTNEKHP